MHNPDRSVGKFRSFFRWPWPMCYLNSKTFLCFNHGLRFKVKPAKVANATLYSSLLSGLEPPCLPTGPASCSTKFRPSTCQQKGNKATRQQGTRMGKIRLFCPHPDDIPLGSLYMSPKRYPHVKRLEHRPPKVIPCFDLHSNLVSFRIWEVITLCGAQIYMFEMKFCLESTKFENINININLHNP